MNIDVSPRALEVGESYGLKAEDLKSIAAHPRTVELDPSSAVREYPVERRTSGDVTVVVGLRDPERPLVMGVYVRTGQRQSKQRAGAGSGGGTSMPTTMRSLRARIIAAGFQIRAGGAHDRVETKDGKFIMALPLSPSDARTIPNCWRTFVRESTKLTGS